MRIAQIAAGPKALTVPFAAGDNAGNLKLHIPGKCIVMRFVARKTGRLDYLWVKVRALPADGSSYVGGTSANWSWTVKFHPVLPSGNFDPSVTLGTPETGLNPNLRQNSDSGGFDGQTVKHVTGGIQVVKGTAYAITWQPDNADPATDYASVNFLYTTSGVGIGAIGAQGRNEINRDVVDAYQGLDPREVIGGCLTDGTGQSYPANNQNYPGPFAKHMPCYVQEYSDGTTEGQAYYTGATLSASVEQTMNYKYPRPTKIVALGMFTSAVDTIPLTVAVNGVDKETLTLTSGAIARRAIGMLATPLDVVPADLVQVRATPTVSGALHEHYSDAVIRDAMGDQAAGGPFWSSANAVRAVPIYPLPWTEPLPAGYGATAAFVAARGSMTSVATSSTSQAVTVSGTVTAGNRLVVCAGGRNQLATLSSVSDTRGNTWTVDKTATYTTGTSTLAIASCHVGTTIQSGDTVTLTWGAMLGPARVAALYEFSGLASSSVVDKTTSSTNDSALNAWAVGPTSTTTQAQEMVVAAFLGIGGGVTSFVAGGYGTMAGPPVVTSGASGGNDRSLGVIFQPVSIAGAYTETVVSDSAIARVGAVVTYKSS